MADPQFTVNLFEQAQNALLNGTNPQDVYSQFELEYSSIPPDQLDESTEEIFASIGQSFRNIYGDDLNPLDISPMLPPLLITPGTTDERKEIVEAWEEQAKSQVKLLGGYDYLFNKEDADKLIAGVASQRKREIDAADKFGINPETGEIAEGGDNLVRFSEGLFADTARSFGASDTADSIEEFFVDNPRNDEDLAGMVFRGLGMGVGQIGVGVAAGLLTGGAGAVGSAANTARGGTAAARAVQGFNAARTTSAASRLGALASAGSGMSLELQSVYNEVLSETGDRDLALQTALMQSPAALVDFLVDYGVTGKVIDPLLKLGGKSKAAKVRAIAKAADEQSTISGLNSLKSSLEAVRGEVSNNLRRVAGGALTAGTGEAISETIQGISGDILVEEATGEAKSPFDLESRANDAFVGFAVGSILGGTGGALSSAQNNVDPVELQRINDDLDARILTIDRELTDKRGAVLESLSNNTVQELQGEPSELNQVREAISDIDSRLNEIPDKSSPEARALVLQRDVLLEDAQLLAIDEEVTSRTDSLNQIGPATNPEILQTRADQAQDLRSLRRQRETILSNRRREAERSTEPRQRLSQELNALSKSSKDPETERQLQRLTEVQNIEESLQDLDLDQLSELRSDIQTVVEAVPSTQSEQGLSNFAKDKLSGIREIIQEKRAEELQGQPLTENAFRTLSDTAKSVIPATATDSQLQEDLATLAELENNISLDNDFKANGELKVPVARRLARNNPELVQDIDLILGTESSTPDQTIANLTRDQVATFISSANEVRALFTDPANLRPVPESTVVQDPSIQSDEAAQVPSSDQGSQQVPSISGPQTSSTPQQQGTEGFSEVPRSEKNIPANLESEQQAVEPGTQEAVPEQEVVGEGRRSQGKTPVRSEPGKLLSAPSINSISDLVNNAPVEGSTIGDSTLVDPFNSSLNSQQVESGNVSEDTAGLREVFPKIQVKPEPVSSPKTSREIIRAMGEFADIGNIRFERLSKSGSVMGTYYPKLGQATITLAGDLNTASHEFAHALDLGWGVFDQWGNTEGSHEFDAELLKFWVWGTPYTDLRGKRAEGSSEFIKAYLYDPETAVATAPKYAAFLFETLPDSKKQELDQLGKDIRGFAAAGGGFRIQAQIETLHNAIDKTSYPFSKVTGLFDTHGGVLGRFSLIGEKLVKGGVLNKLTELALIENAENLTADPNLASVSNKKLVAGSSDPRVVFSAMRKMSAYVQTSIQNGVPTYDPEKLSDWKDGDPPPTLSVGLSAALDPWDGFDAETTSSEVSEAMAFGVAERVVEQTGKLQSKIDSIKSKDKQTATDKKELAKLESQIKVISGSSAGIETLSDFKDAEEFISDIERQSQESAEGSQKFNRIKQFNSSLRNYSKGLLDFLVESGNMSAEQRDGILQDNEAYITMVRILELDVDTALESKGDITKAFKGSSKLIQNPMLSLIEATERVLKAGMNNRANVAFTDLFKSYSDTGSFGPKETTGALSRIATQLETKPENMSQVITSLVDGVPSYWRVSDKVIYDALVDTRTISRKFPGLGPVMSTFQGMITKFPSFLVKNVIRDTAERIVLSKASTSASIAATFRKRGDFSPQLLKQFGGDQSGWYFKDEVDHARALRSVMNDAGIRSNSVFTSLDGLRGLKDWYDGKAELSEQFNRVREFEVQVEELQKQGYSKPDALAIAGYNASTLMDFTSAGQWAAWAGSIFPFAGAGTVGLNKILTTVNTPGQNTKAAAAAMLVVGLPMLMERVAASMGGYEDEFDQQPAYLKDLFINLKLGDNTWLRIPKPYSVAAISGSFGRAWDQSQGKVGAFDGYIGSLMSTTLPINPLELSGPATAVPLAIANYDAFRGKNIVPKHENGLRLSLRNEQYVQNSSDLGQGIQELAIALGIDDTFIAKSFFDPRKVDSLVSNLLGTTGAFVGRSVPDIFTKPEGVERAVRRAAGLIATSPGPYSRDVQWLNEAIANNGLNTRNSEIQGVRELISSYYESNTNKAKQEASEKIIKAAAKLRVKMETEGFERFQLKSIRKRAKQRSDR